MLLSLPEWITDKDIKHEKTSWKLTKDAEATIVEAEIVESNEFLNAWELDLIIPTSEIWYVHALRYLVDGSGNSIGNKKWIGPFPIINEDSNVNDYLAPKFYMSTPYITKLAYTPGTGLDLALTMYDSNVDYEHTIIIVKNNEKKIIYTKNFIISEDNLDLSISSDEINFTDDNVLNIEVINVGKHSTVSSVCRETISVKDIYYNIVGNRIGLNPLDNNIFTVNGSVSLPVTILEASLLKPDHSFIINCVIRGDKFIVPNILAHKESYIVRLKLMYTDENKENKTVNDFINISTLKLTERININENHKYLYEIEKTNSYSKDGIFNIVNNNKYFNTEEIFSNLIPLPGMVNNKINTYIFDSEFKRYIISKDSSYNFDINEYTFRLLDKDIGFVSYTVNSKLVMDLIKYDSYLNTFIKLKTFTPNIVNIFSNINKLVDINGEYFVFGVSSDNNKNILIYKLDTIEQSLNLYSNILIEAVLTDLTACKINDSEILITPIGNNVNGMYKYNIKYNKIIDTFGMPSNFVNCSQFSTRLRNGNIVNIKTNYTTNALEFFYLDVKNNEIKYDTQDLGLNLNVEVKNITLLRNGNLLLNIPDNDKVNLYIFK